MKIFNKIVLISILIIFSIILNINSTYCKYVIELSYPSIKIENIDKEAPLINGKNYYGDEMDLLNKPITINYSDNVKLKTAVYYYNATSNNFENSTSNTFDSGTSFNKEGYYKIVITDTTDNITTYNFVIDTIAPEVVAIANRDVYYTEKTVSYQDNLSGIGSAVYYYNTTEDFTDIEAKPFENNTTFDEFGYYKLVITDKAGNVNTTQFSIIKDTINPKNSVLNVTEANNTGSTFTIKAEDKETGVAKIELYIKDKLYKTYTYNDRQTSKNEKLDVTLSNLPFYEDAYIVTTDYFGNVTSSDKVKPNTTRIRNEEDMYKFSEVVNSGITFSGKKLYLLKDINLEGSESNQWIPIGNPTNPFKGTFEGNYHNISNLYINSSEPVCGLFGSINNANIKNITINDSYIKGMYSIGALSAGANSSTIENVHISSDVVLIGTKNGPYGVNIGGIIGSGSLDTILKSSNKATITGNGKFVGGIVGCIGGKIEQCYNRGTVTGENHVGGIAGLNYQNATIINCYNTGNVKGQVNIGGIAGSSHDTYGILTITNCYNIGNISANSNSFGGILGFSANASLVPVLSNNYWLSTCGPGYGVGYIVGVGFADNTGAESKTSAELKAFAPTLGTAFTSDTKNLNNGYPVLTWQK